MVDRIEPGPDQESVWDYPRPPAIEAVTARLVVTFADVVIADTTAAHRVLETSHPPTYYLPADDVRLDLLKPALDRSFCEWKGAATYHHVVVGDRRAVSAAWSYPEPTPRFGAITDAVSFYADRVDRCTVDGEVVQAQEGDFYGGWITSAVVGPFKGPAGTLFW